jgi:hypothetical protein
MHQFLIVDARVQSRDSPCGICGGRSGMRAHFSPSISDFLVSHLSTSARSVLMLSPTVMCLCYVPEEEICFVEILLPIFVCCMSVNLLTT